MARRIAGIDVGGTFTDLVMQEADGTIRIAKVPTTSANQAGGVLDAIAAAGTAPAALDLIVHGTTATTNAVLERKLAKVGLITTAGFRDVLELGRRTRPRAYGMTVGTEPIWIGAVSPTEISRRYIISQTHTVRLFAQARQEGLIGWERSNNRGDCWISPALVRDYKYWQAIKFSAVSRAVSDACETLHGLEAPVGLEGGSAHGV